MHYRKHFLSKILVCLGFLLYGSITAQATVMRYVPLDRLIREADLIVSGKVARIQFQWDEKDRTVYTYITIAVDRFIKRRIKTRYVTIKEWGGQIGNVAAVQLGTPYYRVGEEVVVCGAKRKDGSLATLGGLQGKFEIGRDPESDLLVRRLDQDQVLLLDAHGKRVENSQTRISMSEFLRMVKTRASALERHAAIEIVECFNSLRTSGQDVPAGIEVAESCGFIREGVRENTLPDFMLDPDNQIGVANTVGVVQDALRVWSNLPTTVDISLNFAGRAAVKLPKSFDGINAIRTNIDLANPIPGSVTFGCATLYFRAGTNIILESDVAIDPVVNEDCFFGSVVVHELGHALGLGHPSLSGFETMAQSNRRDGRCACLTDFDVNLVIEQYGGPRNATRFQVNQPGQNFPIGAPLPVTWVSTGISVNEVRVDLSRNGPRGPWETIIDRTPNTGSATWTVTGPTSNSCRIRVRTINDPPQGTCVFAINNSNFSITPGQADIIARPTGEPTVRPGYGRPQAEFGRYQDTQYDDGRYETFVTDHYYAGEWGDYLELSWDTGQGQFPRLSTTSRPTRIEIQIKVRHHAVGDSDYVQVGLYNHMAGRYDYWALSQTLRPGTWTYLTVIDTNPSAHVDALGNYRLLFSIVLPGESGANAARVDFDQVNLVFKFQ
jgi:hypothetical protein